MKLETESLAVTAAITAAAIFTLFTALLALFPEFITQIWSNAWHIGSQLSSGNLTLTSYVLGLCLWAVGAFAVFAIAGGIYNRLSKRRPARILFPSLEIPNSGAIQRAFRESGDSQDKPKKEAT